MELPEDQNSFTTGLAI